MSQTQKLEEIKENFRLYFIEEFKQEKAKAMYLKKGINNMRPLEYENFLFKDFRRSIVNSFCNQNNFDINAIIEFSNKLGTHKTNLFNELMMYSHEIDISGKGFYKLITVWANPENFSKAFEV
jgi:hypothetical protein